MRVLSLLLAVVASIGFCLDAEAALVLQIQNTTVNPASLPTTVGVDVSVYSDSGAVLTPAFDLKFDVQGPGLTFVGQGLPTGITAAGRFLTNPAISSGAGTAIVVGANITRDFYVNADGATAISISSDSNNPTRLFTMNFNVASGTTGFNPITFVNSGAFGLYDDTLDRNPITIATLTNGGIGVAAVPEPSALAFAMIVIVGKGGYLLRKKLAKNRSVLPA